MDCAHNEFFDLGQRITGRSRLSCETRLLAAKLGCVILAVAGPGMDVRRVSVAAGLFFFLTICGFVGGAIGHGKNRTDHGIFWSLLLGPAGWFIADVVLKPKCAFCNEQVSQTAMRCKACGAELFARESFHATSRTG